MHAAVFVRVYVLVVVFEHVFVLVPELVFEPAYRLVEVAILRFFVHLYVSVAVAAVFFLVEDVFVAVSVGMSVSVDIDACMWWDLDIDAAVFVAVALFVVVTEDVTAAVAATLATVAVVFALVIVVAVAGAVAGEFDLECEIVTAVAVAVVFGAVTAVLAGGDGRFQRHLCIDDDAEQMVDGTQMADKDRLVPTRTADVVDRRDEDWRMHRCLVEWSYVDVAGHS